MLSMLYDMKSLYRFLSITLGVFGCCWQLTAQQPNKKGVDVTTLKDEEIDSLLEQHFKTFKYKGGLVYAHEGLKRRYKSAGVKDSAYVEFAHALGYLYNQLGNHTKADKYYKIAYSNFTAIFDSLHPNYGTIIHNYGALQVELGNYDLAEKLYLKAAAITENNYGRKHRNYANNRNSLALFYRQIGHYPKAEQLYLEALSIYQELSGKEHQDYIQPLINLAALYFLQGQYALAEPLYLEAKALAEKVLGKKHPAYITLVNNLALFYQRMGKDNEAKELWLTAQALLIEVYGKNSTMYLNSLIALSKHFNKMDDKEEVTRLLKEVELLATQMLPDNHPNLAMIYQYIGDSYLKEKKRKEAINYLKKASSIYALYKANKRLEWIKNQISLARAYLSIGDREQSMACLNQSFQEAFGLPFQLPLTRTWVDSILAISNQQQKEFAYMVDGALNVGYDLFRKQGEVEAQLMVVELAIKLLDGVRAAYSLEKDQLRILKLSNRWLSKSLNVFEGAENYQRAFELAEYNKSVLLLKSLHSKSAYHFGELPDSLIQKERLLNNKKKDLLARLQEGYISNTNEEQARSTLNEVNQSIKEIKKYIAKDYPKYASFKDRQTVPSLSTFQKALNEETALLEYVVTDSSTYVFYLDKDTLLIHRCAIGETKLIKQAAKFRQSLGDYKLIANEPAIAYQKYTQLAYWFYQNLLEPALAGQDHIKKLVVIADGGLRYLPFEAFLITDAPQKRTAYSELDYLLKKYTVSYNYSASLWYENNQYQHQKNNNGELFAMAADYTYKHTEAELLPTYRTYREKLVSLPAAREEVEMLSTYFDGYYAFDGQASEHTFKKKASDYAVIHLAAHGLLQKEQPLLSWIAFTDNGDQTENNFLQAYEISKMELNADLVVLSACETGYGVVEKGNGMASLARSFMYAGAPALVVSLWGLNDYTTAQIVKRFYVNLGEGLTIGTALQDAKLWYLNQRKHDPIIDHPAYWASLVFVGKDTVIPLESKSYKWIWIGIIFLSLGVFFYYLRFRKKE